MPVVPKEHVSRDGVKPSPHNIAKIIQFPSPTSITEVRQVLGMGSYYRRFIHKYSEFVWLSLPEKTSFVWTETCQLALDSLKRKLTSSDIMAYPLDDGEYILDTDASDLAIGAALSQLQNGQEKVVAYASRTMNRAEKNYWSLTFEFTIFCWIFPWWTTRLGSVFRVLSCRLPVYAKRFHRVHSEHAHAWTWSEATCRDYIWQRKFWKLTSNKLWELRRES